MRIEPVEPLARAPRVDSRHQPVPHRREKRDAPAPCPPIVDTFEPAPPCDPKDIGVYEDPRRR